jgi:curved DNA-binding protein CbpA
MNSAPPPRTDYASLDADTIEQWLTSLDSLSYYDLLGVDHAASADALRDAFHAFAASFHPDGHACRPAHEQLAIDTIFKRGTEAYRILSDHEMRVRYDDALVHGALRPDLDNAPRGPSLRPKSLSNMPPASTRPSDCVRVKAARPFVVRAEELGKRGDAQQAKLQLVMAMHLDPQNEALEAFAADLEATLRRAKTEPAKSWKK